MGCYLRIFGDFVPDELLAEIKARTEPCRRWTKGDIETKQQKYPNSGILFHVSDAPFDDYQRQFGDAVRFLWCHQEWIRATSRHQTVTAAFVDFGLKQDEYPAYFRRLPLALIQWAAVCFVEIELSFYAISVEKEDVSCDRTEDSAQHQQNNECSGGEEPTSDCTHG